MAADTIHYDTECMESLCTDLKRISKSLRHEATGLRLINLVRSGADIHTCHIGNVHLHTTGQTLGSALTPVLIHRTASAMYDVADHIQRLVKRIAQAAEAFESCERALAGITLEEYPDKPQAVDPNNTKEQDLEQILSMLHSATPPSELASVKYAENELSNPLNWLGRNAYAVISGNYTDCDGPVSSIYGQTLYTFNTFFDGLVPEGFEPWSMEDIAFILPGTKGYEDVVNILKILGAPGPATGGMSLVGSMTEEMLSSINQLRLLQCMDKDAVLSRADVYKQSSDPSMVAVGYTMEFLINADPVVQIALMNGKYGVSNAGDAGEYLIDLGLDYVSGGSVELAFNALSRITGAIDLAANGDSYPGLCNDVVYSADIANESYDVFQNAMAAYEADPSDANLQRAMEAYETYQHTAADSMNALDALMDNTTNSHAGQSINALTGMGDLSNGGWIEAQRDNHRNQANTMRQLNNQYSAK